MTVSVHQWPAERPHNAVVKRVIDGDTIVCDIDLDLRTWLHDYHVRFEGCNAAEHTTEAGKAARDHLTALLPEGTSLVLSMIKDYKYGGEFVARVWTVEGELDLIAWLIKDQWLAEWDGHGPRPTAPWPRTVS